VVVEGDLSDLNARLAQYSIIALLVWMVSLAVALAISLPLSRAISAPIVGLSEKARAVSENRDYSVRAEEKGEEEIKVLVRTFNQMLDYIQSREKDLEAARDKALEASRLKTAFLANMSHEIRTPLNVILGYSELIEDRLDASKDAEDLIMLYAIRRAGARLMKTIEEILDMSRIESGAFELRKVVIPLGKLVEDTVAELGVLAERKGIRLDARVDFPAAAALFDHYCLSHALVNLVSNAIKFTERGGVTVRVSRDVDGRLALSVADTGIGIAPDYLPHLFESFSQEDVGLTRRFEGSGLGLVLVKRYAEMNGAAVTVSSRKGHGSTFTIHLAADSEVSMNRPKVAANAVLAPPSRPAEQKTGATTTRIKALVVEDDPDNQSYMRSILNQRYEVLVAASPPEAERQLALHGEEIGIIFMDISLREAEDGLTLTRSLRNNPSWASIPIVATTALAQREDRARAEAAGCDAYLSKPVTRKSLFQAIQSVLAPSPEMPVSTDRAAE
jgi:signal transduction histidine kinase/ActR/RegA family two-component response regulator